MEIVGLNVVILPPDNISKDAIDLSKELFNSKIGTSFALESGRRYPHITIYQAYYPIYNLAEIKSRLSNLSKELNNFDINLDTISIFFDNWIFWNCEKTKELETLQAKVIDQLNPLREGHLPPNINLANLSKEYANDINDYGSLLIGDNYLPHITISYIKDSSDSEEALKITGDSLTRDFTFNKLCLTTLGDFGTVTNVIDTF